MTANETDYSTHPAFAASVERARRNNAELRARNTPADEILVAPGRVVRVTGLDPLGARAERWRRAAAAGAERRRRARDVAAAPRPHLEGIKL